MGIDDEGPDNEGWDPSLYQGHRFHRAAYSQKEFGDDHDHCLRCFRTIAETGHKNSDSEGYVAIHDVQYEGLPKHRIYKWACSDCFSKYRVALGWIIEDGPVPPIDPVETEEFMAAYRRWKARDRSRGSRG